MWVARNQSGARIVLGLVCALAMSSAALADLDQLSYELFRIDVATEGYTGQWVFTQDDLICGARGDGYCIVSMEGEVGIVANENPDITLATLGSDFYMCFYYDPQIQMNFSVTANYTADTDFSITSAQLDFDNIPNAWGRSTVSMDITDADWDGSGQLTGKYADNKTYRTFYNVDTTPGMFSSQVDSFGFSNQYGWTEARYSNDPGAGGVRQVGSDVHNLQSGLEFTLSAGDTAVGSTDFEVVPEPAAIALLGLALVLVRRR